MCGLLPWLATARPAIRLLMKLQPMALMTFFFVYLLTFVIGSMIMVFAGFDFESAIGAVNCTLGCIGPGLGSVGPVYNFQHISVFGKYFLSFLMLLGRLEFYSLLILITPAFWKL